MSLRRTSAVLALCLAVIGGCESYTKPAPMALKGEIKPAWKLDLNPSRDSYLRIRGQVEQALRRELALFFPATVDREQGGFRHALPAQWATMSPEARQKLCVYQARMTWTAAEVAKRRPDLREQYLSYAQHGFAFLRDKMWDAEQGGFFWAVQDDGKPDAKMTDKHLYGNAFGMYACANVYEVTKDPAALDLAVKAFRWLEEHGHDARNGGYYEDFTRNGEVVLEAGKSWDPQNPNDILGYPYGYKSMNAHIHLMEALTVLVPLRPDDVQMRRRLDEVHLLVRDKMAVRPGCLNLLFTPDWKSPPMSDSFGHDIETAYLIDEADIVRHGAPNSKTRMVSKMLVDHSLQVGWDAEAGALNYEGFAFGEAHNKTKSWWAQAESLNALLLMHEKYGKEDSKYWKAFVQQWRWIQTKQIDAKTGGWYYDIGADGKVKRPELIGPWKAAYHTSRAMLNVSDRLTRLAEEPTSGPAPQ